MTKPNNNMRKTNKMATIISRTRRGKTSFIERRVFEDENGISFVRINNTWFSFGDLVRMGDRVNVWF